MAAAQTASKSTGLAACGSDHSLSATRDASVATLIPVECRSASTATTCPHEYPQPVYAPLPWSGQSAGGGAGASSGVLPAMLPRGPMGPAAQARRSSPNAAAAIGSDAVGR